MSGKLQYLCVLVAACACLSLAATITHKDCVERSLCYHSTDCCSGCCDDNQCVKPENFTSASECRDAGVARTCASLRCPEGQECSHEMRFCLIAPCPQPLPECVAARKNARNENSSPVPLPVKY